MFDPSADPAHAQNRVLRSTADGTVKQVNPFTGEQVWTVPGRASRLLAHAGASPALLEPGAHAAACDFCEANKLRTPPERSRLVADGDGFSILRDVMPDELDATVAEFRRVPNQFEIVPYDYWRRNYGYTMPAARRAHMERYLADPTGRSHVLQTVRARLEAAGHDTDVTEQQLLELAPAYFGGGHDVIIARRHYVDGANNSAQLAGSGQLSAEEHYRFIALTVDALGDLVNQLTYARYVAVFQNWLSPAGASKEHLHKQLVAIDDYGPVVEAEASRLRRNANLFNDFGVDLAFSQGLVIADNDHAILVAGVGHRFPTMTVYAKSRACEPWEHSPEEVRAVSDLLHAAHAATGVQVATNEEWHYRPSGLDVAMPWRIDVKWRVSTPAGFEGATQIYVNTVSPFAVRDQATDALRSLRGRGHVSASIRIGEECVPATNVLRYNPELDPELHPDEER